MGDEEKQAATTFTVLVTNSQPGAFRLLVRLGRKEESSGSV